MTAASFSSRAFPVTDSAGAWVPHGRFVVPPTGSGPLSNLTFAAKDLYDVAGHVTGAGNPTWLATHAPATAHNPIVARLLDQGATLLGKVISDELAYSVHGDNQHYGTPRNHRAPDRVPGGSSSGSAAAVAAGLCDFALGTDTGGSTRVPASYCGLWGLRTTQGLLPTDGLVPLAPDFDTPTWLADDASVFQRVGDALLDATDHRFTGALWLEDAWAEAEAVFPDLRQPVRDALAALGLTVDTGRAGEAPLEDWRTTYVTASAFQAWATHRAWIEAHQPRFAPAIAGRWNMAAGIGHADAVDAFARIALWRRALHERLGAGLVAVVPSASGEAPALDAGAGEVEQVRARTFRITSIAGVAGLPQVSLPLPGVTGAPLGLSLIGPAGSDRALIHLAGALHDRLANITGTDQTP